MATNSDSAPRMIQAEFGLCGSCGGELLNLATLDGRPWGLEASRCRVCEIIICDTCTLVFDHDKNGKHGTGDPGEEIARLQTFETEARACLKNLEKL